MLNIRKDYAVLNKSVLNAITAEFFIQFISASFLFILPLYMRTEGYTDGRIAGYISFRFFGILITTLPLGYFIKGRKMKGFFMTTGILMPICAIASIEAINLHMGWLISLSQLLFGISYCFTSVASLPYIIRNEKAENQTEAIALHYVVWSLGVLVTCSMTGFLNMLDPHIFNERNILLLIAILGFSNLYFLSRIKDENVPPIKNKLTGIHKEFDWKIIGYTLFPCALIGIGAGLAIPYIPLFFANVHHMTTGGFAFTTAVSGALVVLATLYTPTVKRRMGMSGAITYVQIAAVVALSLLASTEYFNMYSYAVIVAIVAYLCRNPLMNMVGPLTSELSMNYVGKKNQEITSAFISAISSGGYFFSAMIFKVLREHNVNYASIFFITAGLYFVAAIIYYGMSAKYLSRAEESL